MEKAKINWLLSIDYEDIPYAAKANGKTTFRSLKMENNEIEFSEGFTDLHTLSYREILKDNGFGINDARPSIELVHRLRHK